jgi:hypothetical protein
VRRRGVEIVLAPSLLPLASAPHEVMWPSLVLQTGEHNCTNTAMRCYDAGVEMLPGVGALLQARGHHAANDKRACYDRHRQAAIT